MIKSEKVEINKKTIFASKNIKKHKGGRDPKGFDHIVREIYAPIYPVIAKQIKQKTNTTSGVCIDAGCGTGALGRAIAKISNLHIIFFDQSKEMLDFAKEHALKENILDKSTFIEGDIHNINCKSNSIDLVISRGSSIFWDDLHKAYAEILRVLKKGGHAYIGGGFGTKELQDSIRATMKKENPDWESSSKHRAKLSKVQKETLPQILKELNHTSHNIIEDDSGYWVFITK